MSRASILLILLVVVFSAVLGVIPVVNTFSKSGSPQTPPIASPVIKDYIVVHIGESNYLLDEVLELLRISEANIVKFSDPEEASQNLNALMAKAKGVLITFSGDYLDKNLDNNSFINSLKKLNYLCEEAKCAFLAIGGKTSRLFEVLLRAGIYNMWHPGWVNPVYWDPPAAGFEHKVCTDGTRKWLVPGVFGSNAQTLKSLIEGIIEWLQYRGPCDL